MRCFTARGFEPRNDDSADNSWRTVFLEKFIAERGRVLRELLLFLHLLASPSSSELRRFRHRISKLHPVAQKFYSIQLASRWHEIPYVDIEISKINRPSYARV